MRPMEPRGRATAIAVAAAVVLAPFAPGPAAGSTIGSAAGASDGEAAAAAATVLDEPVAYTPHIRTGKDVSETVVVGHTAFIAGEFTKIENAKRTRSFKRQNFAAYSVTTGKVSPLRIDFDGAVYAMEASPSGDFLYIGGAFTHVGDVHAPYLAKVRVSDGSVVQTFHWPGSIVKDVQFSQGRVFVAGRFARALVAVRPRTGAFTPYVDLNITGSLSGAPTKVAKIAISPNGRSLVAIGDFTAVNSSSRNSAFRLRLRDKHARLKEWHPQRFDSECIPRIPFYLRDVAWSPDGSYFVIVSSGGPGGGYPAAGFCDAAGRWEASSAGSIAEPTWINWTGGDSLYSVAVGDDAIYVGGHQRWLDNPMGHDSEGPGAYTVDSIGVIHPANGLADRDWSALPMTRGHGKETLTLFPGGLLVGGDGNVIAGAYHRGTAIFPS